MRYCGESISEGKAHISNTKKYQDLDSYAAEILPRTLAGNESLLEPKEKVSTVPWAIAYVPPHPGVGLQRQSGKMESE